MQFKFQNYLTKLLNNEVSLTTILIMTDSKLGSVL